MEFIDIWNEFCFRIKNSDQNAPEREFQIIAESLFEKLGWLQYKSEIISRKAIPIGAANSIKPDIIIENDGKKLFVVELKKTNKFISERNVGQLFSYMRLLKLNLGILIGETLQVYYELPQDDKPPIKIKELIFKPDSKDGINLLKLLSKNGYSFGNMENYCKDNLEIMNNNQKAQKYINVLCSIDGINIIKNLLKEKLSLEYSQEITFSIINDIEINIFRKRSISNVTNTIQVNQDNTIESTSRGNELRKGDAVNICEANGVTLEGEITFASKNKGAPNYWANPNIQYLQNNWSLLLNDYIERRLHVFYIPANSILQDQIRLRADDTNKIDLQIKYESEIFEDSRSGINFVNWFVQTISY